MRSLTILFVFISFQTSLAQNYIPFPDSNAVWTDYLVNVTCPQPTHICHVNLFYLNGDTVIGSYSYNKMYIQSFGHGYHGAIRNDVAARKVYFVDHHTTVDTLLYDFDLEIGDTLTSTYLYNADNFPEGSMISDIDSIYSGGIYRKQYHVYNSFWGNLPSLIEGIGHTGGLFEGFLYPEGMSQLMCFRYNDTLYYPEGSSAFECEMPWQPPHCSDTTYIPTITGPLVVCQGDTILLEAESGYDSYLWSTGETTQSIEVSDSGDYFVSALVDTCWFNSDTVGIIISNPQPEIIEYADTLFCIPSFTSYQWYCNGQPISGATAQYSCIPISQGNYYVKVTDSFGCIGTSVTIECGFGCNTSCDVGLQNISNASLIIYPNPATNEITIDFGLWIGNPIAIGFELEIINTFGQSVYQAAIQNPKSAINLEGFSKGLYLFKVRAGDEVVVRKVVVE